VWQYSAADSAPVWHLKQAGGGGRAGTSGMSISAAEPHHFYVSPAPGKNFDAAPAPILLCSKAKFFK
jgi:hypothetical protein